MNKKLKALIGECDVISFDIFDTLIKRKCGKPSGVFDLVAEELVAFEQRTDANGTAKDSFKNSFRQNRIAAEKKVRKKKGRSEVSLAEIYDELGKLIKIDKVIGKRTEQQVEESVCYVNKEMKWVYDYCLAHGKTIFLTSDMYLDEVCIKKIIDNAGYTGYKRLLLSVQYGKRKATGELFGILKNEAVVESETTTESKAAFAKILHIGDNKKTDYLMAIRCGLKAYLYRPGLERESIQARLSEFLSENGPHNTDFYIDFGYRILGPAVCGYSLWLIRQLSEMGIKKVYFFAREGQFIKKAFDEFSANQFEEHYLYVSRRSLAVPALFFAKTLDDFLALRPIYDRVKVRDQIVKVGLGKESFFNTNLIDGSLLDKTFSELKFDEKWHVQEVLFKESKENAQKELNILVKYLEQEGISGDIAVIDLGWNGSMQRSLVQICQGNGMDVNIIGFFLAQRDEFYKNAQYINNHGFLFEYGKVSKKENLLLNSGTNLLELLFAADHGSTRTYQEQDGKVIPVLEDYEYGRVYGTIKRCQDAALQFVRDFKNSWDYGNHENSESHINYDKYGIDDREHEFFEPMYKILKRPSPSVVKNWGDMPYSDMNEISLYLAPEIQLNSVRGCMKAFKDAGWKTAFLRRNFGIYFSFELYSYLRKIFN